MKIHYSLAATVIAAVTAVLFVASCASTPAERSFEQQPPLIPHKIESYRIDLKKNRCLECHDRPFYMEAEAPKIGDSHYKDREGKELTHIWMGRYNCNECHVPQADAQPLVGNTFQPVKTGN